MRLKWVPEKNLQDYKWSYVDEISQTAKAEMKKIVDGYKQGGMIDIKTQEITFICDEYYCVDDAFLQDFWIYQIVLTTHLY
jgi:hypothetical protein